MNTSTSIKLSKECYVIAEAGLNHNGSLEIAKKLIDVAAIAGTDAVKFQKRTVEKLAIESALNAKDDRFPEFGKTYREIREHLEFTLDQYRELKQHTESRGLDFMVTAFDTDAVDFLEELDLDFYKVASHSLTNFELLHYLARLRKPTVLSTGMAELEEIDQAVEIFRHHDAPLSLMHCVSAYPTPLAECNLAMMAVLRERYDLDIGYSGHEFGYLPTLIAVTMGAQLVERHYTIDKMMTGFDHKISLSSDELIAMVRDIRNVPKIQGNGKKKVSETEWVTRRKYHVSMTSAKAIPLDTILDDTMITWRNPGTGISSKMAHIVIGKRAKHNIPANELLSIDMFE
jgi:sialic acid synthase SpsE